MMETFDKHRVSFVSFTQQFNTATSMGRLVLNVLLSFAQSEREIISERTRDKIAATRRMDKWASLSGRTATSRSPMRPAAPSGCATFFVRVGQAAWFATPSSR
jgi:DNA invertase Pin-like site-specific DNA recombinase